MKKFKSFFFVILLSGALLSFSSCSDDDDNGGASVNTITFTKANNADWTLESNQDRITNNVSITRADSGFIFNISEESNASGACSSAIPAGTEWAIGKVSDGLDNLTFGSLLSVNLFDCEPPNMVGQDLVLHLIEDDIYLDIKFTSWTKGVNGGGPGGGGFSYTRTTVN